MKRMDSRISSTLIGIAATRFTLTGCKYHRRINSACCLPSGEPLCVAIVRPNRRHHPPAQSAAGYEPLRNVRHSRAPASRRPPPCLVAPRCASFQLSSEVRRSTPTKNKRVKPIHIANHKFCQESGKSRTVAKVAATIIAKPVDVMKRILRRTWRSRSCGSPFCILATRASVSPLPSAL